MKLTVKVLATGKVIELDLPQDITVLDTKKRIESLEGSPTPFQRLIFGGKTLRDDRTLQDCGIQKEAVVHLVLRLSNSLTITIRTMTGKTITLEVKPSDTVAAVQAMIEEIAQIAADKHSLNFAGQRLAKNRALSDCGIMDKATLRLILEPLPSGTTASGLGAVSASDNTRAQSNGMFKTFFEMCSAGERLINKVAGSSTSSGTDGGEALGKEIQSACGQLQASEEQDRIRVYGDLGTLYARCGGIFGIAAFVDRCMDKWMADATLNANPAVATWHAKAQRCGFKFLVTQLMGYLTGGPQLYTGRSMAEAHKHLNISSLEWGNFMEIFRDVCQEFALPECDAEDLAAILLSMEEDCVVHIGEEVPAKPGPALLEGESLYARLGGVYPIALFADRLVDALLADKRVKMPVDGQKRNEASLKYLFTEVVCHVTGGPEVITSTVCTETRLLLSGRKIFYFLNAAKDASDHFCTSALQSELVACMYSIQNLIVDPQREVRLSANMADRRQKITALGEKTGVQLLYIPGGGVVKLDFDASAKQLEDIRLGLAELGLKTVEKTKVKTAGEAAAGSMLSSATIAARYASPGSFVAARKRVHGDPRTLYGRGGGVFGLAKLADRLMDVWMSDPTLNANDMVARWHQSQQKFGFKFLVTQIFGYLTGGPQRYTGQPMDVAHKHLGITLAQWDSFMACADRVFREFKVDRATQQDLSGILASLRDQIIVPDGEAVPRDPDLCRKPPNGTSLYAQAGGVYPLARFVDALVDLALASSDIGIPHDPTFKQHHQDSSTSSLSLCAPVLEALRSLRHVVSTVQSLLCRLTIGESSWTLSARLLQQSGSPQ
jgi:truncated hemoglobin YjbI